LSFRVYKKKNKFQPSTEKNLRWILDLGSIISVSGLYKSGRSQKRSQRGQKGSIPSRPEITLLLNHPGRKFGRHVKLGSDGWKCWFFSLPFRAQCTIIHSLRAIRNQLVAQEVKVLGDQLHH
jgi:hypothetical protein